MRIVLDTSVVVSALRSRHGASNKLLELAVNGHFKLLASPALFLEYEEVLGRPEQSASHRLSPTELANFLIGLAAIIEPVRVYFQWRPQMLDADDEMVLETALNGRAHAIVTHNIGDFEFAAAQFKLRVASPAAVLRGEK